MARGNEIIVSPEPKGRFVSGIISGTPLPGTVVTPKPGSAIDTSSGLITFEPAGVSAGLMSADGDAIPVGILLSNTKEGKLVSDAYTDGTVVEVYYPVEGEEVNVLFQNQSGTADDVTAGTTKLIVDDGTGKVLPTSGSPQSRPFLSLETYTDPTADKLLHCMYTGQ